MTCDLTVFLTGKNRHWGIQNSILELTTLDTLLKLGRHVSVQSTPQSTLIIWDTLGLNGNTGNEPTVHNLNESGILILLLL